MPPRTPARGLVLVPLALALAMSASCKKEEVVAVEPPPRPIKIYRLSGQLGSTRPDYPGRIKSKKVVELAFDVDGLIIDWNVEEGQQVRKGQILSRVDPRDYQAQAEAARARLRLADAEYRRESKLFASGSGRGDSIARREPCGAAHQAEGFGRHEATGDLRRRHCAQARHRFPERCRA